MTQSVHFSHKYKVGLQSVLVNALKELNRLQGLSSTNLTSLQLSVYIIEESRTITNLTLILVNSVKKIQ